MGQRRIDVQKVKLYFECEDHQTKTDCSPLDLVLCGTPMCEICNEEMSMEDYAKVDVVEMADILEVG
jgi:hypothetical protein